MVLRSRNLVRWHIFYDVYSLTSIKSEHRIFLAMLRSSQLHVELRLIVSFFTLSHHPYTEYTVALVTRPKPGAVSHVFIEIRSSAADAHLHPSPPGASITNSVLGQRP